MKTDQLISAYALGQNAALHGAPEGFGGSGWRHAEAVSAFARRLDTSDLLDYGCGESTLRKALKKRRALVRVREYDPAIKSKSRLPDPAALVVCTDVLEHVEPDRVDAVLAHIQSLSLRGCYLSVATRPANKLLPDGRNAHLIVEDTPWWRGRVLARGGWRVDREEDKRRGDGSGHSVTLWLRVDR